MSDQFSLEVVRKPEQGRCFKAALFDFDGTLSLIREGWQAVMVPYFCEVLGEYDSNATEVERIVHDFVDRITGKQTIYQCIQLAEEVKIRGGSPPDPLEYKKEYLRRLQIRISDRLGELRRKSCSPDDFTVPGGRQFLTLLREAGFKLYLASGTDECYVKEEAGLLDLTRFFDGGVYGAQDDYKTFSKAMVIDRLIKMNNLDGAELVGFGDGYVEIQNVREVGGFAVGAATNESARCGIDQWKRTRLLEAGADAIIPDFSDPNRLFRFLTEGESAENARS